MAYSNCVFRITVLSLVSVFAGVYPAAVERARAETCFAADNDGTYDQDGAVNGVITITDASTSSIPAAATPYECGALDFVIQTGGVLSLEGDEVTGAIAALVLGDLTVESGGTISADGNGCLQSGTLGDAPDATNVCTAGADGAGVRGNDGGGAGGGGNGGRGGNGGIGAGGDTYGSATEPLRFGATGGQAPGAGGGVGGAGGGVVFITAGTLTHEGLISANGGPGAGSQFGPAQRFSGGGAGGAIHILATTIDGAGGTFAAKGGDALGSAGGGGGGRIAVSYEGGSYDFDQGDFDVAGGVSPNATAGTKGTVYLLDSTTNAVRIFHGFTFADEDHVASEWFAEDGASNQYCDLALASDASPSITAENVLLGGAIDCVPTIASFTITQTGPGGSLALPDGAALSVNGALTLDATTSLDVGAGVTIANTLDGANLTLVMPDGDDQAWSAVTVDGAAEGRVVIEASIALELADGTSVRGNPAWANLTELTIDATSSIDADGKGCQSRLIGLLGQDGRAPSCENVCTVGLTGAGKRGNDGGGSGGGGHGGAGGDGGVGAGGATYDYQKNPRFFGASAGGTGGGGGSVGGPGGGLVEISVDGTFTNDGAISARGGQGGGSPVAGRFRVTGGGSGGSIRVRAGDYTCSSGTASFSAVGGDAATIGTGGGGGGGRVLVEAANDICPAQPLSALDANVVATGGLGNDGAENGAVGSLALASAILACADPVGLTVSRDGAAPPSIVNASDGLFVLRASVGSECCDLCICDANGSGDVTATDALITLSAAVGQPVTLQCPACS